MAKKLQMPKKAEKQFQELRARFKITRREFLDYYNAVRKANKKLSGKNYRDQAFMSKKFSLKVGHIKNRGLFTIQKKKVKKVLEKSFTSALNEKLRNNVNNNLLVQFGNNPKVYSIIEKFNKLTDREFKFFFDENPDLSYLKYDSLTDIGDFLDITVENITSRF